MKTAQIKIGNTLLEADLEKSVDLSIPLKRENKVNAFYLPQPVFSTVEAGSFIGDVNRGGSCNVENIILSPHGNGTHTECVGHISKERFTLSQTLKQFYFLALLIDVEPSTNKQIEAPALMKKLNAFRFPVEALIIRTLPNSEEKKETSYSGTNPVHFSKEAIQVIVSSGIQHLLTDLPSVDKEDDPKLTNHHIFWEYPSVSNSGKTITEMIFVPSRTKEGYYLLNLQCLNIETDASPSRPVISKLEIKG